MYLPIFNVALLVSSAMATNFHTCASGPAPVEVRVKGCDAQPCTILHGTDVDAEVDFFAAKNIAKLTAEVKATVFGLTITYPLPDSNACNFLVDSACPLEEGDLATYQLIFPISEAIPSVAVNVQLSLIDADTGNSAACFTIDLEVAA